jgi:hypothetical protein
MTIRQRIRKIVSEFKKEENKSVRKIAESVGIKKSSVGRCLKGLAKRNCHPESSFWETEAGHEWLRILLFAVLYDFGIKGGAGAERLSCFFKRIRIDKHVGVSPTALLKVLRHMEKEIDAYRQFHEEKQRRTGKPQEVVASGDETFFNEVMILVLMDLSSGYLVMEEEAEDRSYETWKNKAQARLKQLRISVRHFVSDRAKALIKLGLEGFECLAGADLFHGEYEISKWLGLGFYRQQSQVTKTLNKAKERLAILRHKDAKPELVKEKASEIEKLEADVQKTCSGKKEYKNVLQKISKAVHPFTLGESKRKSSIDVEKTLFEKAEELEKIAEMHAITDPKCALDKFRRQTKDISSVVDVWWIWAMESLTTYDDIDAELRDWLLYTLLPVLYWHKQMERTQNPNLKMVYKQAWERVLAVWQANPITLNLSSAEIERWRAWAEWMAGKFQRASSAVEGRNGCLSQMYHNGRGLTKPRLKALSVIHNFDLKRTDDTTAAERLFKTQFPDLFEWVVDRMGDLPLPREGRKRAIHNPLILQSVPP